MIQQETMSISGCPRRCETLQRQEHLLAPECRAVKRGRIAHDPDCPLPHMRGDAGTDGRATTAHGARNSLRSLRAICKAYLSLYAKHAMLKLQSMLSKIVRGKEGDAMRTRIRELRRERKMSQAELAEAVGTTRQTITSIEVDK